MFPGGKGFEINQRKAEVFQIGPFVLGHDGGLLVGVEYRCVMEDLMLRAFIRRLVIQRNTLYQLAGCIHDVEPPA
jgi:hypothetical protein